MWSCKLCFILFLISKFQRVQSQHTQVQDNDWDYLIASQRWLPSVCIEWVDKNPFHTCSMPAVPNSWGLGGIRPRKANGVGPKFCNDTWPFNPENVRPIETSLHQNWRNIADESTDYDLWANEWNKYGTCVASDEHFNTQLNYFKGGLKFLKYFPISSILAEHNILPKYKGLYTLDEIYNAIASNLGKPYIDCRSQHGKLYLFEVHICFNINLELIDCGIVFGDKKSSCNSAGIAYPMSDKLPIKTQTWSIVKAYKLATYLQLFNNLYDSCMYVFSTKTLLPHNEV